MSKIIKQLDANQSINGFPREMKCVLYLFTGYVGISSSDFTMSTSILLVMNGAHALKCPHRNTDFCLSNCTDPVG